MRRIPMSGWSVPALVLLSASSAAQSYSNDFSSGLGAASVFNDAGLASGGLALTPEMENTDGQFQVDSYSSAGSFFASFDYRFTTGPSSSLSPGDGISFFLAEVENGQHEFFPGFFGNVGEDGTSTGLSVSFDLFEFSPLGTEIRLRVDGTEVAAAPNVISRTADSGLFRPITIELKPDGTVTVTYNGSAVFTDVPTSFTPSASNRFGFGARCGQANSEHLIDNLVITAPPANDSCLTPIALSGAFGDTPYDATGATTDGADAAGFCDYGAFGDEQNYYDVWFTYTPDVGGCTYISTLGLTSVDTRLTVYEGTACPDDPSTILACVDDEALPTTSPFEAGLDVNLATGQTYTIRLGTFDAGTAPGPGTLRIAAGPQADVASGGGNPGAPGCFTDCNANAIPDIDELMAMTSLDCNANGVPDECDALTEWASSVIDFSSEFSPTGWSAAQALGEPDTLTYGDLPTAWAPTSQNGTLEFLTLGFSPSVYTNAVTIRETFGNGFVYQVDVVDELDVLHTVWTGTDPSLPGAPADFSVNFPTTDYLVKGVRVYVDTDATLDWEEIDAVRLHAACPPPPNDACTNAEPIFGTGLFDFDNTMASTDGLGDQLCGCGNGLVGSGSSSDPQIGKDVWFLWIAPTSEIYTVSTVGLAGGADTKIGIQEACGLAPIACNDDEPTFTSPESEVRFRANAGSVYRIRVGTGGGSPSGAVGMFSINPGATLPAVVQTASFGSSDYAYLEASSWTDAQLAAEELGGNLATIETQEEHDFLYNTFLHGWIGLNDRQVEGTFEWASGIPVGYTNWNSFEPSNSALIEGEDFAHLALFYTFGEWNDDAGCRRYPGIVELPGSFPESCEGDGGNQAGCTNCPCGNNAPIGSLGGCLNSNGTSARLVASGTGDLISGDLRFEMEGAVPQSFAVLVSGAAIAPTNPTNPCTGLDTGVQSALLDGLRCAVQQTQRHGGRPVAIDGTVGMGLTNGWGPPNGPPGGIGNAAGFAPGQTRHFQVFYRELPGTSCGTEQNTTQAVSVTFFGSEK